MPQPRSGRRLCIGGAGQARHPRPHAPIEAPWDDACDRSGEEPGRACSPERRVCVPRGSPPPAQARLQYQTPPTFTDARSRAARHRAQEPEEGTLSAMGYPVHWPSRRHPRDLGVGPLRRRFGQPASVRTTCYAICTNSRTASGASIRIGRPASLPRTNHGGRQQACRARSSCEPLCKGPNAILQPSNSWRAPRYALHHTIASHGCCGRGIPAGR